MGDEILRINNLKLSFSLDKKVEESLRGVNLRVKKGEILVILGESGSGKSLLTHAIMGLLPSNSEISGEIYFNGNKLSEKDKIALRGREIFLIPQSINYLDPLSKIKNEIGKERGKELLSKYNLGEEVLDMYPFQLSGGMARRVLVTIGSFGEGKFIIADEPTPGLDSKTLDTVLQSFLEMKSKGTTILMITHDIDSALKIGDRIAIFKDGEIIEVGEADELEKPYSKELLKGKIFCKGKGEWDKEEHILSCTDLSFKYKNMYILNSVNLSFSSNEVVGIFAPSGYGKTTLGKILGGYLKPTKGAVMMDGKMYINKGYNPVQLIFQHPEKAVDQRWRMRKILGEGIFPTEEELKNIGIKDEWLERFPRELSGGELQRFCVLRALNPKSRFIIADEITTMLDNISREVIWNVVLDYIHKNNIGLIVISHEKEMLNGICDRVINLEVVNEDGEGLSAK